MISPDLIIFGVQGLLRLGNAARQSYEQHVLNAPIPLANLEFPKFSDDQKLWNVFDGEVEHRGRLTGNGDLADCWIEGGSRQVKDDASRQRLYAEAVKIIGGAVEGSDWHAIRLRQQPSALLFAAQFKEGAGPPGPAVRMAFAFADVALGFVVAYPGLLGVGGNGEKLLSGMAKNVQALLPDIDNEADWQTKPGAATYYFAERAFSIVLQAGLETISAHPDALFEEAHLQTLLNKVLEPLVSEFRAGGISRPSLETLRDTLLGPMAKAAVAVLHENPKAFLGDDADPGKAVGAVTQALLGAALQDDLKTLFTQTGMVRLYRAALGVAVAKPELFFEGQDASDEIARDLLSSLGTVLKDAPVPFTKSLGAELAATALDCLSENAPALLRSGEDAWRGMAAELVRSVVEGVRDGLRAGGPGATLDEVFSREQALRLATIFMTHAARTPGMIVGKQASDELKGIVAVFCTAIAAKNARLMSGEDWLVIAELVIAEAAKNPMRLFAIAAPGQANIPPEKQFLAGMLKTLLDAAGPALDQQRRSAGVLLFGGTLREAIALTIRAASGNSEEARAHVTELSVLVTRLNALASAQPGRVGAREWLFLFERHVAQVLDKGTLDKMTDDDLLAKLNIPVV
jgi:hypothetical protein